VRCSKKLISTVVILKLNNSVTKKMSGYGRGRHLLSESDSEMEQNNERRRQNITPHDRQPVPSVSSERPSAVTGQRSSRFEIYGNTRRIPLERIDIPSTVADSNSPNLHVHDQSEFDTYLNRQLNRPSTTAQAATNIPSTSRQEASEQINSNQPSIINPQPPSYESLFGARKFSTSAAEKRETLETELEKLSRKLITDMQFIMAQYDNDRRFLIQRFYKDSIV
jgi:hypothetical protein